MLVMTSFASVTILSNSRILAMILILSYGFIRKYNKNSNSIPLYAYLFPLYVVIVGLNETDNISQLISLSFTVFFWMLLFRQINSMSVDASSLTYISVIMSICCNILALLYVYFVLSAVDSMETESQRVAALNSIYLVLGLFPFIFILRKWIWHCLFSVIPVYAMMLSTKSTCIICLLTISIFYIYKMLRFLGTKSFFFLMFLLLIFIALSLHPQIINYVFSILKLDLETGGSGRIEIYQQIIILFNNSDWFYVIFGHGVNSISSTIGIGGHNDILEVLYCYGIWGVILFCMMLYYFISLRIKGRYCKMAYFISLIILFYSILFSKVFVTQLGMIPFALFAGVLSAFSHGINNSSLKMNQNV